MSTLDLGPDEEYGLGSDARKLLVASFRAPGVVQRKTYRRIYDQSDEFQAETRVPLESRRRESNS